MEFMPESAPTATLILLFTGFLLFVTVLAAVHALAAGKRNRAGMLLLSAFAVAALYVAAIVIASVSSHDRVLAGGESKYFCEIDCHLAYSVMGVTRTKTIETVRGPSTAQGVFYIVDVKVWFDERTISPRRGDFPLAPDPRKVLVVTDDGREYVVLPEFGMDLARPLRPGESHEATLVFDLPEKAVNPRLWIAASGLMSHLIIGHENSPLHKKVTFSLGD